jgi:hypothetical protein
MCIENREFYAELENYDYTLVAKWSQRKFKLKQGKMEFKTFFILTFLMHFVTKILYIRILLNQHKILVFFIPNMNIKKPPLTKALFQIF